MSTVADIGRYLNEFAPLELSESWDNTGLLVGRQNIEVHRLMTCLTVTPDVVEEAVREAVQLIVSHHPMLFRGAKQVSDRTVEGGMLLRLIESGIAVYSPHTAFDSAAGGINQQLAEALGLTEIRPLQPHVSDETLGSGRHGRLPSPVSLAEFLKTISAVVRVRHLQFCGDLQRPVQHVAVGCGAAEGFLTDAQVLGCDTFVTGEARFHTALDARSMGIGLVLTGHFGSERPAVERLAEVLSGRFPGIRCLASRVERDPLSVFTVDN